MRYLYIASLCSIGPQDPQCPLQLTFFSLPLYSGTEVCQGCGMIICFGLHIASVPRPLRSSMPSSVNLFSLPLYSDSALWEGYGMITFCFGFHIASVPRPSRPSTNSSPNPSCLRAATSDGRTASTPACSFSCPPTKPTTGW